jgi:hypothetical protein
MPPTIRATSRIKAGGVTYAAGDVVTTVSLDEARASRAFQIIEDGADDAPAVASECAPCADVPEALRRFDLPPVAVEALGRLRRTLDADPAADPKVRAIAEKRRAVGRKRADLEERVGAMEAAEAEAAAALDAAAEAMHEARVGVELGTVEDAAEAEAAHAAAEEAHASASEAAAEARKEAGHLRQTLADALARLDAEHAEALRQSETRVMFERRRLAEALGNLALALAAQACHVVEAAQDLQTDTRQRFDRDGWGAKPLPGGGTPQRSRYEAPRLGALARVLTDEKLWIHEKLTERGIHAVPNQRLGRRYALNGDGA